MFVLTLEIQLSGKSGKWTKKGNGSEEAEKVKSLWQTAHTIPTENLS